MFEPECQNIDCPQCLVGKIYFDREIGYYCMLCGRQYSAIDVEVRVEKTVLTGLPAQESDRDRKKPAVEIRELPARKSETEHISPKVIKDNKPEQ